MCKTQCVLAFLALCLGLAHSSWDFVVATNKNRFEFYNNYKIEYSEIHLPAGVIEWITYDPIHNRVLYATYYNWHYFLTSYDVRTEATQFFIKEYPLSNIKTYAYDPVTELIYASDENSLYSFELKPGEENPVNGTVVINLEKDEGEFREAAVDSCGQYIYWISDNYKIERARVDGTDKEVIIDNENHKFKKCLNIEKNKIYWIEYPVNNDHVYTVESADLNGNNKTTLYSQTNEKHLMPVTLTITKDFIYWANTVKDVWKLPKNLTHVTDETGILYSSEESFHLMAANYETEELNQTIQGCEAAKRNISSVKDSKNTSLFCVHGAKVVQGGKSFCICTRGYTSEKCDVSVCQNYCVQGDCSISAEGQPECRCNADYSGARCDSIACHNYCLNNGVCSLNETSQPVCQCTEGYEGARCDVPVFLIKCVQTVTLLKDLIKADVASVNLGKKVDSTCASTVA